MAKICEKLIGEMQEEMEIGLRKEKERLETEVAATQQERLDMAEREKKFKKAGRKEALEKAKTTVTKSLEKMYDGRLGAVFSFARTILQRLNVTHMERQIAQNAIIEDHSPVQARERMVDELKEFEMPANELKVLERALPWIFFLR